VEYRTKHHARQEPVSTATPLPFSSAPKKTLRSTACREAAVDYLILVELADTGALLDWWYGEKNPRPTLSPEASA